MKLTTIQKGFYQINLGFVNAFLIDINGELILIDTGVPKKAGEIVEAIVQAGSDITKLKHIILTHAHPDHIGSVAELRRMSGAKVYAHSIVAPLIEAGNCRRPGAPLKPSPGVMSHIFSWLMPLIASGKVTPLQVDVKVQDGDIICGRFKVLHTSGHSAGHIALLFNDSGKNVLIAGDICMNMSKLAYSMVYEDIALGRSSIAKAAAQQFDIAVFGHGNPIMENADKLLRNADFYKAKL
ncbi:MAG: MBL fold metallo-hydrolase [Taibaiella sp.]|nr:MBL fold metallo-hydrolase [Taibaiella sp.]